MTAWRRNVYVLAVGVFIAQSGFSIVVPFLPALVEELGVEGSVGAWSGLLFAVNLLAYSLMAPVWGSLSDRVGKRPMMVRAGLGIAATYVLMAYATDVWQLALWRAVNGLIGGYIPAANALAASDTPDERLGWALGFLQGASAAGLVSGPLVGGVAAELVGTRGALLVAAALLAAAGLLPVLVSVEERVPPRRSGASLAGVVLRDVRECLSDGYLRRLFELELLFSAGQLFVQPTLPPYVANLVPGRAMMATGVVYSAVGVATAAGSPLATRAAEQDAAATLRWTLAASAALAAAHGLWPDVVYLTAVRFAFGLATAAANVALGVLIARRVPPSLRGRTFGVLQSVTGVGGAAGPLVGGLVGDILGPAASFWAMAAAFAVAWALSPARPQPAPTVSRRLPAP